MRYWSGILLAALAAAGAAAAAETARFTDVTEASGLKGILDAHYAAHPQWWLSGLHLVDLDGDGDLDLFLSSHGRGPALATVNDGKGHFAVATGSYPGTEILLGYDRDEDGRLDLSMRYQDGGARWWRNLSRPGELRLEPTGIARGTNTARRQAMIDVDRDGKVDWLRGRGGGIALDLADGRGGFAEEARFLHVSDDRRSEVLCLPVDIDQDGDIDLLAEWGHYQTPAGNSRILQNQGKMDFVDVTAQAGLPTADISIKGAGDVDQDGDTDLICLEARRRLTVYLNDGRGKFAEKKNAIDGDQKGISMASWGVAVTTDFDNDGTADVLANGKHFLKILRGTGGGSFVYMNPRWGIADVSASSVDDGLCFGDTDADGDLDIVGYTSAGGQRRVALYRNDLPPRKWVRVRPVGLPGNRGAAGAKIRIYDPATEELLWYEQVATYNSQAAASYYAHTQTERHFGLGNRAAVDVQVEFYPSGKKIWRRGVPANQTILACESPDSGTQ